MEKNLKEVLEETNKQKKSLLAKERQLSSLAKAYPDATIAVLESGSTGYLSKSVSSESKNVKIEFMYNGSSQRYYYRYYVMCGKTPVYSVNLYRLDTRHVLDMLNKYGAFPSSQSHFKEIQSL